jgi:hypothetical protein
MAPEIIVVSGLPRSGTSLMMQMLAQGGVEVLTDEIRGADTDNPRGYYELEKVKKIKQDASWLPEARGRAFKMVSQLLYDLPRSETYNIVFMQRDLDEMLASQEKMLARLGRPAAPRDEMKRSYRLHVARLSDWLRGQPNMNTLLVSYNEVLNHPAEEARRVGEFLRRELDLDGMVGAVDPSLYHNKAPSRLG